MAKINTPWKLIGNEVTDSKGNVIMYASPSGTPGRRNYLYMIKAVNNYKNENGIRN